MGNLVVREHGTGTKLVIALHGGPAAAGDVAPLARELGKRWHALEPLQRGSGGPVRVATHVEDLDDVIREHCREHRPVLVGHSWGAMLALAYAADHPATPAGLALVGCGTFSTVTREEFRTRLDARLTPADRASLVYIEQTEPDPNRRLAAIGRLMTRVCGHDVEEGAAEVSAVDAAAHDETWTDMLRLQREGVYPAAFAVIKVPVLMIHGTQDPHPGKLIRDELRRYIPHLEYRELPACGHSPWLERQARAHFFDTLQDWIARRFEPAEPVDGRDR